MQSQSNTDSRLLHEVLCVVLQVRSNRLAVLLWRRALGPHLGRWSLPGGRLRRDEDVESSIRRQLTEKVDLRTLAHVEQLAVFSDPERVPGPREVATAFLGLVPSTVEPAVPEDTAWHPVDALPRTAFDHEQIALRARERVRSKLSYTNIGFALAPEEFTVAQLRDLYSAALGYRVSATNLQRVLTRRDLLESTGRTATPGRFGGRPAALYRFTGHGVQVTDPAAVLRPPAPG